MVSRKELATLAVSLKMENAQFKRAVKDTQREVQGLNKRLKTIGGAVKGLFAVESVRLFRSALGSVMGELDRLDAVSRRAERLGIVTHELQALQYAAESAGVDVNQFNVALQRMARRIGDAQRGSKTMRQEIESLGLSWSRLATLPLEQQFAEVLTAIKAINNENDRLSAAGKIFDSEGIGVLQMSEDLETARERFQELNGEFDEFAVQRVREATQAAQDMQVVWQSIQRELALAVVNAAKFWGVMKEGEAQQEKRWWQFDPKRAIWRREYWQTDEAEAEWPADKQREWQKNLERFREMDRKAAQEKLEVTSKQTEEEDKINQKIRDRLGMFRTLPAMIAMGVHEAERMGIMQERDKQMKELERTARPTPGVGAYSIQTQAGFSAVQSSNRVLEENLRLDRERNRIHEETNRKLDELNRRTGVVVDF